jgi:hypothetical protein
MIIEKIDNVSLPDDAIVKVKLCGNIAEVKYTQSANAIPRIKKIDKDRYVVLATGEVRDFKHNQTRKDDLLSVKESLERLKDYLNTNVTNVRNCRFLTLTYKEEMTDPNRLYADFKAFNRKCRKRFGHYEYIVSAEPQRPRTQDGLGVWHLHCVFIFAKKAPFMENETVSEIWGNGFVNIRAIRNVTDVGRYLTAYLADMPVDDIGKIPAEIKANQIKNVEIKEGDRVVNKAILKGFRLIYYPTNFNLYRISKGVRKPSTMRMTSIEADTMLSDWAMTYQTTYKIVDADRGFDNIVSTMHFNKLLGYKEKALLEKAKLEQESK